MQYTTISISIMKLMNRDIDHLTFLCRSAQMLFKTFSKNTGWIIRWMKVSQNMLFVHAEQIGIQILRHSLFSHSNYIF